ncbi:MAG: phosphotransferase [Chloroflexota bacterium]
MRRTDFRRTRAPPATPERRLRRRAVVLLPHPESMLLRDLLQRLHRQWVPATDLPVQLVHGDVRLSNVRRTSEDSAGETVYLDFGFLARRPRVHDLAYSLAFMVWALDGLRAPQRFAWETVPRLIEAYEAAAGSRLTPVERRALAPYTAAVPLYAAALDGFTEAPRGKFCTRLPFLRLGEWLLAHPSALPG